MTIKRLSFCFPVLGLMLRKISHHLWLLTMVIWLVVCCLELLETQRFKILAKAAALAVQYLLMILQQSSALRLVESTRWFPRTLIYVLSEAGPCVTANRMWTQPFLIEIQKGCSPFRSFELGFTISEPNEDVQGSAGQSCLVSHALLLRFSWREETMGGCKNSSLHPETCLTCGIFKEHSSTSAESWYSPVMKLPHSLLWSYSLLSNFS